VNLPEHGFHLRFEARSQCLRLIEVYDPSRVHCRYNGALVDGGASAVTLQRVSALFGPTFPGEMCSERGLVALHYPGLTFLFAGVTTAHAHGQAARIVLCAPAAHAGGTHARLDAVLAAAPPPPPAGAPPPLRVMLGVGLRVGHAGGALPFGCSPQDLVAELGPPSASMVKGSDAMLIHALPGQLQASGTGDYFLTWWDRGLDVLVDGEARRQRCVQACMLARVALTLRCCCAQTHRAKKFVLHTNSACHPEFGAYTKASFVLETPRGATLDADARWEARDAPQPAHAARADAAALRGANAGGAGGAGAQRAPGGVLRPRGPRRRGQPVRAAADFRVRLQRRGVRGAAQRAAGQCDAVRAAAPRRRCLRAARRHAARHAAACAVTSRFGEQQLYAKHCNTHTHTLRYLRVCVASRIALRTPECLLIFRPPQLQRAPLPRIRLLARNTGTRHAARSALPWRTAVMRWTA
jgi:hypothetical protein